jgi:predicted ferric reductase
LLAVLALPFPRKFLYELFLKSHYALAFFATYSLWQHARSENPFNTNRIFLLVSIGLLILFNVTRIVGILYRNTSKSLSWTTARVARFDGATELIISVPRPWKVKPGQWMYLWTRATSFWSFYQRHPFAIAWWSDDEKGRAVTVSLLVKAQHGLSRRLAMINPRESFTVALDGPYGQAVDTTPYKTLVLFATGVGIGTQLSVLKKAFGDYQTGGNILRRISIIWQMDSESQLRRPRLSSQLTKVQWNKHGLNLGSIS